MTDSEAKIIARACFRNRGSIAGGVQCGCFYCQATFRGDEIREWVDDNQTALCPCCGIDAVLAGVIDAGTLRELRHHRFETTMRLSEYEWQMALAKQTTT